jgi:hypothetical protein
VDDPGAVGIPPDWRLEGTELSDILGTEDGRRLDEAIGNLLGEELGRVVDGGALGP